MKKRTFVYIRFEVDSKDEKLLSTVRHYLNLLKNKKNLLVTVYDGEYHVYDKSFLDSEVCDV